MLICFQHKIQVSQIQPKEATDVTNIPELVIFAREKIIFKSGETLKTTQLDTEFPRRKER